MKRFRNLAPMFLARAALTLLILATGSVAAQTVYVTRGAQGEGSFSDQPQPCAERLELAIAPPAAPSDATTIETMLAVADSLAEARQEREASRRQDRLAQLVPQAAPAPQVVPVVQQGPGWFWRRPGFRQRSGVPFRAGYERQVGLGYGHRFEFERGFDPGFRGPGREAQPRRRSRPLPP